MATRSRKSLIVLLGLTVVFALSIVLGSGVSKGTVHADPGVTKNLAVAGRGVRLLPEATTDVWALDGYSYIGTFNTPCGDGTGANGSGVRIFDTHNPQKVSFAGFIPSVADSRANDVKVANMSSGDVLVHSNESCAGGPGGFEVWDVDDPTNPTHLASVRIDELAEITPFFFSPGTLEDVGVHNLFLFSQGASDYVAAVAGTAFDNFMIFDITDPTNPALASAWGAEELFDPGVGDLTLADDPTGSRTLASLLWLFDGFGASANRFLHDITINGDESTHAYLSNWDAGLVLLDISDPTNPSVVSVALSPTAGSLDGEVNSHAAWPSADGSVVVETEEDFEVFSGEQPLSNFTFQERTTNTIPGVGISTNAGSDFESNPTGNNVTVTATSVAVNSGPLASNTYPAEEGAGNQPKLADVGPVTGEAVWIGRACDGDTILNSSAFDAGDIAVVRRGTCFFGDKLANAAAIGASAIIVANNVPDTVWGGVRIWDYSDPANPVLASTFNTVCSANPDDTSCDPRGTYSVHNVIVEEGKAYISWYSDGVLVLDISDPYNPVEVSRFHREGSEFEAENGGIQDVWGIYKIPEEPWIYASDRNGGLYILKEYGGGSAGRGRP
jgi:hypothetical protein